jgi:hypothetical protein
MIPLSLGRRIHKQRRTAVQPFAQSCPYDGQRHPRARRGPHSAAWFRLQSIKLAAPTTEQIADLLRRHWPVDEATALRIAVGSGGCVRAALADLESWLDVEGLS